MQVYCTEILPHCYSLQCNSYLPTTITSLKCYAFPRGVWQQQKLCISKQSINYVKQKLTIDLEMWHWTLCLHIINCLIMCRLHKVLQVVFSKKDHQQTSIRFASVAVLSLECYNININNVVFDVSSSITSQKI